MLFNRIMVLVLLLHYFVYAKVNYYNHSMEVDKKINIDYFDRDGLEGKKPNIPKSWQNNNNYNFEEEAELNGVLAKNYFSDFKSNISDPILSDKNATTIDGSKSFRQNISCDKNVSVFVEIDYYLGDLDSPIFKVSTEPDENGRFSEIFNAQYDATGICSNGIIVCPDNVFDENTTCGYYKWEYDNGLNLKEVEKSTMQDCTCINKSCSNYHKALSVTDKQVILERVSGAIYAVIAPSKQSKMLNKAVSENGKYVIYGQRMGNCNNFQGDEAIKGNIVATENFKNIVDYGDKKSKIIADENSALNIVNNSAIKTRSNSNYMFYSETEQMVNDAVIINKKTKKNTNHILGTTIFDVNTKLSNSRVGGTVGVNTARLKNMNKEAYKCVVKIATNERGKIYTNNTTKQQQTNSQITYKYEARICTNNGTECPYSYPEIIYKRCGNNNGSFERNMAILSSIDEISKDVICTTK